MAEENESDVTYDRFLEDCRSLENRYPPKILQLSPRQAVNYLQSLGKLVGIAADLPFARKNLASHMKPTFESLEERGDDIRQALVSFMSKRLELSKLLTGLTEALESAAAELAEQLAAVIEYNIFGRLPEPDSRRLLRQKALRRRAAFRPAVANPPSWRRFPPPLLRLSRVELCKYLIFGAFLIDDEIDTWTKEILEKARNQGRGQGESASKRFPAGRKILESDISGHTKGSSQP